MRLTWMACAVGLAALLVGMTCGGLEEVRITEPGVGVQVSEAAFSVVAEVKGSIDPATVRLQVDGVDLIGGLGLEYPFLDAAGTVSVGPDVVTVSSFDFEPPASGTIRVFLDIAGLSPGTHTVAIEGLRSSDGEMRQGTRTVEVSASPGLASPAFTAVSSSAPKI